ncbi:nucleotidyltransferase domain-containing protein [bacterium]|nr:nucleotidyltransferase domain-containing protein [bacterium]
MKTRELICNELNDFLYQNDHVLAVWEGGSVATGFADEYSDLDLVIVVNDDYVEEMFRSLDEFINQKYRTIRKFRVPEPAWHGFSQTFYQAQDVPEYFYFDISVMKKSLEDKFLETNRHGTPKIWFEKEIFVLPVDSNQDDIDKRTKKLFQMATATDFITILEIKKGIKRGLFSEVFPLYFTFIVRHLVALLNIIHRPEKADFNLRYIYRDYPLQDYKLIEDGLQVVNISDLSLKFNLLLEKYEALKLEILNPNNVQATA